MPQFKGLIHKLGPIGNAERAPNPVANTVKTAAKALTVRRLRSATSSHTHMVVAA